MTKMKHARFPVTLSFVLTHSSDRFNLLIYIHIYIYIYIYIYLYLIKQSNPQMQRLSRSAKNDVQMKAFFLSPLSLKMH